VVVAAAIDVILVDGLKGRLMVIVDGGVGEAARVEVEGGGGKGEGPRTMSCG
jgi:hypothetical protein